MFGREIMWPAIGVLSLVWYEDSYELETWWSLIILVAVCVVCFFSFAFRIFSSSGELRDEFLTRVVQQRRRGVLGEREPPQDRRPSSKRLGAFQAGFRQTQGHPQGVWSTRFFFLCYSYNSLGQFFLDQDHFTCLKYIYDMTIIYLCIRCVSYIHNMCL